MCSLSSNLTSRATIPRPSLPSPTANIQRSTVSRAASQQHAALDEVREHGAQTIEKRSVDHDLALMCDLRDRLAHQLVVARKTQHQRMHHRVELPDARLLLLWPALYAQVRRHPLVAAIGVGPLVHGVVE